MSILVRTGNGITDLTYVDSATKGLKVLQKTGEKTVQWITTAAGTTYQNILQKRGVKDLFYGSITIPADEPAWAANPKSGGNVLYGTYISQTTLNNYGRGSLDITYHNTTIHSSSSFFGMTAGSKQPMTDINTSLGTVGASNGIIMNWEVNADHFQTNPFASSVKKIFLVNTSDASKKLVAILTFNRVEQKSGGNGYYIYYTVRNIFNSITDKSGTYTLGIRSSDS